MLLGRRHSLAYVLLANHLSQDVIHNISLIVTRLPPKVIPNVNAWDAAFEIQLLSPWSRGIKCP